MDKINVKLRGKVRMKNIVELKEAVDNSNLSTEQKAEQILMIKHIRVPWICYAVLVFGLGSAIYGVYSTMLFIVVAGIVVFFVVLIDILKVVETKRRFGGYE